MTRSIHWSITSRDYQTNASVSALYKLMKFHSKSTQQEIDELNDKIDREKDRYKDWHSYFAWYPCRMGDTSEMRWLEWIERRGEFKSIACYGFPLRWRLDYYWEYRKPNG